MLISCFYILHLTLTSGFHSCNDDLTPIFIDFFNLQSASNCTYIQVAIGLIKKLKKKKKSVFRLNSHLHLNSRMRVVVTDFKILYAEIANLLHIPFDFQFREGADVPLKLQRETDGACFKSLECIKVNMAVLTHLLFKRFDVVGVHVSISQGVNKVSRLKGQKIVTYIYSTTRSKFYLFTVTKNFDNNFSLQFSTKSGKVQQNFLKNGCTLTWSPVMCAIM